MLTWQGAFWEEQSKRNDPAVKVRHLGNSASVRSWPSLLRPPQVRTGTQTSFNAPLSRAPRGFAGSARSIAGTHTNLPWLESRW